MTGDLPTGTVTFLFTDIEGSTALLHRLGDRYPAVLEDHARLIREAVEVNGGVEVSTEGDAFFCVFAGAPASLAAAVAAQRALAVHTWPDDLEVRVRMGLHSGEGVLGGDNYVGIDVHRAARIAAAGHGGQVLVSDATRSLAEHALPDGVTLRDRGSHRLKDIAEPEALHELVIDGLERDLPPLRTLEPVLDNLPAQLTSFLGRDEEVIRVAATLGETRLVTLTGPGGTGKSRLAVAAAAATDGRFPDGRWFVPLATITDPALLATAIIDELGLRRAAGHELDQLVQHFRVLRSLLVLDNFEQLLPAAPTVSNLLRDCPELRVLVTSRAPLRVSGEQEVPVPPLPVPDPRAVTTTVSVLAEYPSVRLFVERAQAASPGFTPSDDDILTVAEITANLDGLPLAIELAAALVKLLPPRAIAARLGRRLDVLTGGPQDLPERQRSLRDAIAWSYELLDDGPRRLLQSMAVFAGGATFELVEEVCAPGDAGMLFDALRTLVDQSLVVRTEDGDEARFVMLGAIREFALEQLDARGEADAVRRRHADAFRALAIEADRGIRGVDEPRWAARIDREFDNFRAAVTWGIQAHDHEIVTSLTGSLFRFAIFRIREEVFRWAEAALELPGVEGSDQFVEVCGIAAWGFVLRGDLVRALELARIGDEAAGGEDDPSRAHVLDVLSSISLFEGRLEDAARYAQGAGRIADDDFERGYSLVVESLALAYGGNLDAAMALVGRLREIATRSTAPTMVAWARYTEGETLMGRDPERALVILDEAVAIAESVGSRFLVGVAQVSASSLRARHGDPLAALGTFRSLIEEWRRAEHWTQLWTTLRSVAEAFARIGELETAAVLGAALVEVDRGAPVFGDDADRFEALATQLEAEVDAEPLAAARARGRALDDDAVISFVLAEIDRLLAADRVPSDV